MLSQSKKFTKYPLPVILFSRYFHAAVCVPSLKAMFVFGGLVTDSEQRVNATNEMWKFCLDTERWTRLEVGTHFYVFIVNQ